MKNPSVSSALYLTAALTFTFIHEIEVTLAFQAPRVGLPIVSVLPSTSTYPSPHRPKFGNLNLHPISNSHDATSSSSPFSYSSSSLTRLSLSRRQILTQDDLAKPPNQKLIEVIDSLPPQQQQSIIASDMASQTGLSLAETQQSLSSLASLTRGDISVTSDGELVYTFPSNVQSVLKTNSLRYKLSTLWGKTIWPKLFWGIRVSFGVFLFVSIAAIFSTLVFIQSGGGSSDDDRDDGRGGSNRGVGGGGFGFRYGVGDFLFDVFYPRPYLYSTNYYGYYGRYDPYYTEQIQEEEENTPIEERGGLFESIFSYIFGDGDPNRNLERARLRSVSRLIRANGGAVTAEQLAPFCDVEDPDGLMRDDFSLSDEGFVLPVVSQLGGVPSVTEDGDIIYLFPDLQVSTMDEDEVDDILEAEKQSMIKMDYLQEMNIDFNRNEGIGNILAGGLGVVNLVGALYLGQVLASPAMSGVQMAGIFGLVQAGYPVLLIYALLFNIIPAVRFFNNKRLNEQISKRNSARRKWLTYVQVGGSQITRKLGAAKSLRQKMKRLVGSGRDTVYDTRTKMEDLSAAKEAEEMRKFDELLGKSDKGKNDDGGIFQ